MSNTRKPRKPQGTIDANQVGIMVNGHMTTIDARKIPFDGSVECHGTTRDGTKVRSPRFKQIGESFVIWPSGKGLAYSMTRADAEMLTVHLARELGIKTDHPHGATGTA